jgi:sigma-B regulation protein RsbU (phosphoserine phosphatase)
MSDFDELLDGALEEYGSSETEQIETSEAPEAPEDSGRKVLRWTSRASDRSDSISELVSSRWYVNSEASILDLADDLNADQSVEAVTVTDPDNRVMGIVVRRDLFDMLGRRFGREVLRRERVGDAAKGVRIFYYDTSVFRVSDEIADELQERTVDYFALKTENGEPAGLFSTTDMLIHLSNITRRDFALARTIQSRVVRDYDRLDTDHFELVGASSMAQGVGGDFYAERKYDDNKWLISVCDVSGKGMSSSLLTCAIWGMVNTYEARRGVGRLVTSLNDFFLRTFEHEKFVTGVFFDFDQESGRIALCDCGHGYVFLLRDKKLRHIKNDQEVPPIGVTDELRPRLARLVLEPDDVLVILTDGIIEQENPRGHTYPLRRIEGILADPELPSLKSAKVRILEDFHRFKENAPVHDDITFVMLRYKG